MVESPTCVLTHLLGKPRLEVDRVRRRDKHIKCDPVLGSIHKQNPVQSTRLKFANVCESTGLWQIPISRAEVIAFEFIVFYYMSEGNYCSFLNARNGLLERNYLLKIHFP